MCVATTAAPAAAATGEILGVGEAADVVSEAGARGEGRLGDRRPPGVDARSATSNRFTVRLDDRNDAFEFLALVDLVTRPGLDAADVQDVRAFIDQSVGARKERVEVVRSAAGSKKESRVRLRTPMTSARDVRSYVVAPSERNMVAGG